jgi:Ca-activated chloride channel homolog
VEFIRLTDCRELDVSSLLGLLVDWIQSYYLLLLPPSFALLWWFNRRSLRPLSIGRRRALLIARAALVALSLLALAGPALKTATDKQAVIFVLDHSQSQAESGMKAACEYVGRLTANLPRGAQIGILSAGNSARVLRLPGDDRSRVEPDLSLQKTDGGQTDLASAVSLACALFPAGASRRIVLVGDGVQTRGDMEAAARDAAIMNVVIDAVPIAGQQRPDVRLVGVGSDKQRSHEGASIELRAEVESSLDGKGVIRLFENGVEVESRALQLSVGERRIEVFQRTPEERNLYTYRVRVEGFEGDKIIENNEAMTFVDVRGRPLLLYIEGEDNQAHYLVEAMAKEGIQLQTRPVDAFPQTLQELAGFDGIILSDVPAHRLSERTMALIRDYVEQLGGGFVMAGGKNSFGVGGYYRTPIEEILPVKMKAPDKEEQFATALMLVIDRSGSMTGQKVEICKSAAIATVDLLSPKDYVGVVAFDSQAHWVVPITRVSSKGAISSQIATINAGGGTNIYPGMTEGRQALASVRAKVKHMIVLTDGQTEGSGFQELAAQIHNEGVTISTVAVGNDAAGALLQTIAAAGGGQAYQTLDPSNIPRIFTQDTMVHMGRLIREESFAPRYIEQHLMLKGFDIEEAPMLLGYVKTSRKATAQVPLVTDLGDPLLAHWQFGLGKVTAFTSDCKSRWAALWITGWPRFGQFWAQVLRETARKPQSPYMDMRLEQHGRKTEIHVDVLEDAAHFNNEATVAADVYFMAAGSLGSAMRPVNHLELRQIGPGRYQSEFAPDEPGVYFVRSRSGAQVISAGLVHNASGEAATGRIDSNLLEKVCAITGGTLFDKAIDRLPFHASSYRQLIDITPLLLKLLLVLLLVEVAIRRWENIKGMLAIFKSDR